MPGAASRAITFEIKSCGWNSLAKVPSSQRFFSVSETSPDSSRCIRSLQIAGRKMALSALTGRGGAVSLMRLAHGGMHVMAHLLSRTTDQKLAELEKARTWSPRVISKLEALLQDADSWALYRVNPIKFAADKGIDETESIDLFLHAAKLGLFRMEWQLLCPHCSDTVSSFHSLSTLRSTCFCPLCHLETQAQLDDYIHVSFTVSPEVREAPFHKPLFLSAEDYVLKYRLAQEAKASNGMVQTDRFRHISFAICWLEAGEIRDFKVKVGNTMVLGHDMVGGQGFMAASKPGGANELLAVLENGAWTLSQTEVGDGLLEIKAVNKSPKRALLVLARMPKNHDGAPLTMAPCLTGNKLLNCQTFRSLFRSDTISGSEGIGIRELTLLFTDLKGSTEMYERIGDIKAFALVQQHFEHLTRAIQTHHGAVVKTIGDAVMACFDKPADAVSASLLMRDEIETFNRQQGSNEIVLKIGIHMGASIAVTLNDRLDYFGQTVNIAARVQGLAEAEEICITQSVFDAPGVQSQLGHFDVSEETASVKGLSKRLPFWRVREKGLPEPA